MRPQTPTLDTARLILRPLQLDDSEAIQALFPQWDIVKFMTTNVPWPYPDDGAQTYVGDVALPAVERGEAWHWSIRPRSMPERLIGLINLVKADGDNRGFWIDPAWQRQGLMTEAADAVTAYWFGPLGQSVLRAPKAVANEGSRRLSERAGMRVVWQGERDYVCGPHPAEMWEITADEWKARRRSGQGPA